MPRSRKKWLSESKKLELIDEYVITCCSTNPPSLNLKAESKLPSELITEAREKLTRVMPELQRVRQRAKLIENVEEDIQHLIEDLVEIKGLEELDTDSHRRRWRLHKTNDDGDWED